MWCFLYKTLTKVVFLWLFLRVVIIMIALLLFLGLLGSCWGFKDQSHMAAVSGGKPVTLLYADNIVKDEIRSWHTIEWWYMNKPYSMCPPHPLTYHHQRWFFIPFDSGNKKQILIHAQGQKMFRFAPNVTLDNSGCLLLKNLTSEWYGRFLYAPNYRVKARWVFKPPTGYRRPVSKDLIFTPTVVSPTTMVKLCVPLDDLLTRGRSVRWHFVKTGHPVQEFAYRYDSSYWWAGYPYSQFTAQNIFRYGHLSTFYTDGCVKTLLEKDSFVFATTSSDSAGNNDVRRYIWKGYAAESERPQQWPKLGIVGVTKNPNTFHHQGTNNYWYVQGGEHVGFADWEPRIYTNVSWVRGQKVELCTLYNRRPARDQAIWYFIPWWAPKNFRHAQVVATYQDVTFTDSKSSFHGDVISSPGVQVSNLGRCLTIYNMDSDLAGTWVHFFRRRYFRSTVFELQPAPSARPPADTYRQTHVDLGEKNVWLCPRRDGQMSWTDIKIFLRDPVDGYMQRLFHRYIDWKTAPHNMWFNGHMNYEYLENYVIHFDKTACVVVKEITWETLGTYEIHFRHREGHSWKEVVEFVADSLPTLSPLTTTTTTKLTTTPAAVEPATTSATVEPTTVEPTTTTASLITTTPSTPQDYSVDLTDLVGLDNNPPDQGYVTLFINGTEADEEDETYSHGRSRRKRAFCDGCRTVNWAFNTKYAHLHDSVALQGERMEGCFLTWVNPDGTPMATVDLNNTVHWYQPEGSRWHSENYLVSYETGNMYISKFGRKDQGMWRALHSCPDTARSKSGLTKLVLADTIEHLKADMFARVNFSLYEAVWEGIQVSINGHKPSCLLSPKRCRFNPTTFTFELDILMPEDEGVWIFIHNTTARHPFVKVFTLQTNTPEGCIDVKRADQGLMTIGLHPDMFEQRPIKVLWFRQEAEEKDTLTLIARMEGGYQKEQTVKGVFPFYNGNLWVPPEQCGLYWAFVYSPGEYHLPLALHPFKIDCESRAVGKDSAYVCPPLTSFKYVGEVVESPFPAFAMDNHTVIAMMKNKYQDNYKTLCFAHGGHTLWDSARGVNVSCYFDGSYIVNRAEECGHHLTLAFEKGGRPSTARLLRNFISCAPRRNRRDLSALRSSGGAMEVFFETGIPVNTTDALNSLLNATDHRLLQMATVLANFSSQLFQRRAAPSAAPAPYQQGAPPLVVFPISNFNSSSGVIILISLLILCLFFTLWLVCKWKKQKRDLLARRRLLEHRPPEYAELVKNPIYDPEK